MSKTSRTLLWWSPIPIAMAVFFAFLPWLDEMDEVATWFIGGAFAVFVIAWGKFLAVRTESGLDEVQLAGQRFAHAKGVAGGTVVTVLLLLIAPLMDWFADGLISVTTDPGEPVDRHTVYMAIVFGIVLLVLMQALGTVVAGAIWKRRLGGNG
jgi:hypothetical protein